MSKKDPNPVALEMRRIYCCAGAAFAGPTLEKGWLEIERMEAENKALREAAQAVVDNPSNNDKRNALAALLEEKE